MENMEKNGRDINLIISHNKVIFVDKIDKKDIESGGKVSQGYNHETGDFVLILDKDYGKSAELMRLLLENGEKRPLWKFVLFILIIIILVIGFIAFSISFFSKDEVKTPTTTTTQNIAQNLPTTNTNGVFKNTTVTTPVNDSITTGKENLQTTTGSIDESQNLNIKLSEENASLKIQNDLQIELMKKDYEIESLRLAYDSLVNDINTGEKEKAEILEEKTKLEEKIKILELENENLKAELNEFKEKAQNLSRDEFLLFLGNKISELCEKSEIDGEKNKCKDIYYEFVKNNK